MSVSDSDDSGSLNSMLHVRASELYPKKTLIETQESASIPSPFNPLCGEAIEYISRVTEGILALSNYRIYFQRTGKDGKGDFNIPLGLIESTEIKELFHMYMHCKDARTYRCSFPSNDVCMDWYRRINRALAPPRNFDELFAFVYFTWAREEGSEEIISCLGRDGVVRDIFQSEFERLGFDTDPSWRISSINKDYKLCSSYPRQLIVPSNFTDSVLEVCAKFRSSRRVPAVVWRHKENGMIIARSSQPEVGWFCWRSSEDEELLKCLSDACSTRTQAKPKLLVMDARSYTSAIANRARGGGCECCEYYPNIVMKFMNLPNIHAIRRSFQALRQLCATPADVQNWHSTLDGSKWLSNMSALIAAGVRVVTAIEKDCQPVLVHCSDGWDRTTQIVSLAELLLDPYYRTIEGFQVLCEREWFDFGHKFQDRCGDDMNEKCPVFLQWLDCVQNILQQFPCAFEFSKRYLIKLAEHTYSNLFGTFFCNTNAERQNLGIATRTFSVWRYLNQPYFRNYLYDRNYERVIWPKFHVRDLELWRCLYIDLGVDNQCPNDNESVTENGDQSAQQELENGTLNNLGNKVEPMLLSAMNSCPEMNGESVVNIGDEVILDGDDESRRTTSVEEIHVDTLTNDRSVVDTCVVANEKLKSDDANADFNTSSNCSNNDNSDISPVNGFCDDIANLNINEDNLKTYDNKNINTSDIDEDCDIISNRNTSENSEDCFRIVDELEMRLNCENSVQSSVETIVNTSFSINASSELCEYKTVTNGLKSYDPLICPNGRQQFTSLLLDPIDGLPLIPDDIQDRMQQISIEHKAQIAAMSNELHTTRNALMNKICNQCTHQNSVIPLERQVISDDDKGSVCSTEISWEAVDEKDVGQVLWVPDYAVNFCTSCNSRFWIGRRKHHCRGCGKIFCADCSRNVTSLPNEQLFDPVRVCEECYQVKQVVSPSCLSYANSPKQTTCKQAAAGEEPQNSTLVLPPAPPI